MKSTYHVFSLTVAAALVASSSWAACTTSGSNPKYIYCSAGTTSLSVPSDYNSTNNTWEAYGPGGSGAIASPSAAGGGGCGGGFSSKSNITLTPSTTVTIRVGSGGSASEDTYLCDSTSNCTSIAGSAVKVGAKRGGNGIQTLNADCTQALATSGVGTTKFDGGLGGQVQSTAPDGPPGGGGAAGPNGSGASGGAVTASCGTTVGAGGGGSGGGFPGGSCTATFGHGGNNFSGTGGGSTNGAVGVNGGGGAGSNSGTAGQGGAGIDGLDSIHGAGGGGGGGDPGGNGGLCGGAGAGGQWIAGARGNGADGCLIGKYVPAGFSAGGLMPHAPW